MLGGRMVWVGMSRGRFVGGRNVKAPSDTPGDASWSKNIKIIRDRKRTCRLHIKSPEQYS